MEKFFWQKKCKIKAHSVDSFGASLTLKKKFSTIPDGGCGGWKEILTFCTLNIVLSSRSNTGLQKNIYSSTFYIVRLLTGPLRDQKIFSFSSNKDNLSINPHTHQAQGSCLSKALFPQDFFIVSIC